LGPCDETVDTINKLNLNDDCILLNPTNDDYFIHKLHNTIDVFLHYRIDGECHSTALSQAMMYGIPIISHYGGFNGQQETIASGGYVAYGVQDYTDYLVKLIQDEEFYSIVSNNAKNRAQDFDEAKIVKDWENVYTKLHNEKRN
jgi:glycosyltransferase involved in cell wall biosynthesis